MESSDQPSGTYRPTADWPRLRQRAELLRRAREFFHSRGFLEVETPILSRDTVVDRHLDPLVATTLEQAVGRGPIDSKSARWFLQTSPELGMKRLMAAGAEAIYQMTKVFRGAESGRYHNPEFTMIEWYRAGDDMWPQIQTLSDFIAEMLECDPADCLSYAEAFEEFVGVDPLRASCAQLVEAARRHELVVPQGLSEADRDGWLDLLLVECVQPQIGQTRPTVIYDFPPSQAALAVIRDDDPPVAERFELFYLGFELANGYHELRDAGELRRRFERQNQLREADRKPSLPVESHLLEALRAGLPKCAGVSVGFDRLVMLATGATELSQVLTFPIERA